MVSSSIVSFTIPGFIENGDPETVKSLYPEDVIERAQSILKHIGSIGHTLILRVPVISDNLLLNL